jgi:hypothetical protein
MYSAIEFETDQLASQFCAEAERLWQAEREKSADSVLTIAAAEFLSLGHLGQGRDHHALMYLAEAANMGARMGLFSVKGQANAASTDRQSQSGSSAESRRAYMYAAWGLFNWLTLVPFSHKHITMQPRLISAQPYVVLLSPARHHLSIQAPSSPDTRKGVARHILYAVQCCY